MKRAICLLLALIFALSALPALADVTLVDQTGREVTLERTPKRIVSGYYISTSACIALGLKGRLAAIEAKADTRNIYHLAAPELLALPSVGTAKAFDLEACLAAEPDLVILPKRLADAADALAELGVPALLVDPEDQARLTEMIALLGEAAGAQGRAADLTGFLDAQLSLMQTALEGAEPVTALMLGNSDRLTAATGDMYQSDLLSLAGAVNAIADVSGGDFAALSYEQLLALDPQAIIVPPEASYSADDVRSDPELAPLSAVKNGAVYQMPRDFEAWDSPVPSGVLGALWLASTLHGDCYGEALYRAAATSFYKTFYGFTPEEGAL